MLNVYDVFHVTGRVRSLSSSLWTLTHLTALHINNNNLSRIPPEIAKLPHLVYLNLSSNKLRSLPAELGNMVTLRWLKMSKEHVWQIVRLRLDYTIVKIFGVILFLLLKTRTVKFVPDFKVFILQRPLQGIAFKQQLFTSFTLWTWSAVPVANPWT